MISGESFTFWMFVGVIGGFVAGWESCIHYILRGIRLHGTFYVKHVWYRVIKIGKDEDG